MPDFIKPINICTYFSNAVFISTWILIEIVKMHFTYTIQDFSFSSLLTNLLKKYFLGSRIISIPGRLAIEFNKIDVSNCLKYLPSIIFFKSNIPKPDC